MADRFFRTLSIPHAIFLVIRAWFVLSSRYCCDFLLCRGPGTIKPVEENTSFLLATWVGLTDSLKRRLPFWPVSLEFL